MKSGPAATAPDFAVRECEALVSEQSIAHPGFMDIYHALIERSGPDDIHDRASIEAESLVEAKRIFEEQYGKGKVVSIWGERASERIR